MTQALVNELGCYPEVQFVHLNTQISRSLADKGRRPLAKAIKSLGQTVRYLIRLVAQRPDVVYLPLTNSESFSGFVRDALVIVPAQLAGARVVFRLHGGYCHYMRYNGWRGKLVRAVLGRVTLAMVQGRNLTRIFADILPPERIAVVVNGIDGAPFEKLAVPDAPAATRRVLFVGLLCEAKGVHDILRAAPTVPEAEFVFAGEWATPHEHEMAEQLVREGGLAERVRFPGVLTGRAKAEAFAGAAMFVFPSYYRVEGHAVVTVEALAAGLPIVCTDHGALSESVRDGWNGFIVPARDPTALAQRINHLLADGDLRQRMSANCRLLYAERFTLDRFVQSWVHALLAGIAPHHVAARPK
jgi:glycosyltransferase involved in cell wall biosynthesis